MIPGFFVRNDTHGSLCSQRGTTRFDNSFDQLSLATIGSMKGFSTGVVLIGDKLPLSLIASVVEDDAGEFGRCIESNFFVGLWEPLDCPEISIGAILGLKNPVRLLCPFGGCPFTGFVVTLPRFEGPVDVSAELFATVLIGVVDSLLIGEVS